MSRFSGSNEKNIKQLTSQLAERATDIKKIKTPFFKPYTGGVATFVDDDGKNEFLTVIKPIYDEKGIKCNIAVNTALVGDSIHMTWNQLKTLKAEGYEISSHSHQHLAPSTLTDDELHFQCSESKRLLALNDLDYSTMVYPDGITVGDIDAKNIIKQYFDCGIDSTGQFPAYQPFDSFEVPRFEMSTRTLASAKLLVDLAVTNGGWIIFYTHAADPLFATPERQQFLRDVIDYINSKSMPIVSLSKGLEMKGNVIEIGDKTSGGGYYYLTRQGKEFKANAETNAYLYGASSSSTVPNDITALDKNSTKVTWHPGGSTNAPVTDAGLCMTYRPTDTTDSYSMQLFMTLKNDMYIRIWSGGVFKEWQAVNTTQFKGSSDASKVITSYPLNAATIEYVSAAVGGAATPTLPTTQKKGVMKTFRFFPNAEEYSYQEWKPFDGAEVWIRNWNKTSTIWGAWAKVNAV